MKIEFLPGGSLDCPLMRLYDFDTLQACRLRELMLSLVEGIATEVLLHEAPWVEAVDLKGFALRASESSLGIVQDGAFGAFSCQLDRASWQEVAEKIVPFCETTTRGTYQWLDDTSAISLLLSPNGKW